jgi:fucokinase
MVLPDPDGKRVGSGGATFNVLRYISMQEDRENPFAGKRILVIHSGGDSKRIPQYSAVGKLFSPVPRELPDGRASTLFDEFVIAMSGVPSRIREGMLVLSGDVLLLFNPLQIDSQFHGAAAISIKEPVETGKNHGVFLNDGNGYVKNFLHKQTEETLRESGL